MSVWGFGLTGHIMNLTPPLLWLWLWLWLSLSLSLSRSRLRSLSLYLSLTLSLALSLFHSPSLSLTLFELAGRKTETLLNTSLLDLFDEKVITYTPNSEF